MKIIIVTLVMVLGVLVMARLDRPTPEYLSYQPCAAEDSPGPCYWDAPDPWQPPRSLVLRDA